MSTEPFKLDLIALVDQGVRRDIDINLDEEDPVHIGCRNALGELARQLHAAGAPDAPFEQQVRELLASHRAMQRAGEEMPSDRQVAVAWWGAKPQDNEFPAQGSARAVLAIFAPHYARLTQERDEARRDAAANEHGWRTARDEAVRSHAECAALRQRAERAERELENRDRPQLEAANRLTAEALADNKALRARIAELEASREPGADVVESLAEILASNRGGTSSEHDRADIRAVLARLAAMGWEAIPSNDETNRVAAEQFQDAASRCGFYAGACWYGARLSHVLGALRARVAELEGQLATAEGAIIQMAEVLTSEVLPALADHVTPEVMTKGRAVAELIATVKAGGRS